MPQFSLWELNSVSAGDAFSDPDSANTSLAGVTLTINSGASPIIVNMTDDDTEFFDSDSTQRTDGAQTINGTLYDDGLRIEANYSYTIMPEGSSDPADAIEIYAVRIDSNDIVGFATSAPLDPNVTYVFTGDFNDTPSVQYDDLFVCFTAQTVIATARGEVPVFMLRRGDLVQTKDNGLQPVLWIGRSVVGVNDRTAPVIFAPGVIGNRVALSVSPQHRILVNTDMGESLVAAKAFLGMDGVSRAGGLTASYFHILFERHEVIFSQGAATESFNPGEQGWDMLGRSHRRSLSAYVTRPTYGNSVYALARPVIRPGHWRSAMHRGGAGLLA